MARRIKIMVCAALAVFSALMFGCVPRAVTYTRFTANYFDVFDTVTTLVGFAPDQATFDRVAGQAHDELLRFHRLYDIYNEYDGLNNACTLNKKAAEAPVTVDKNLMALLVYARDMQKKYPGKGNIALGAVLKIWHQYREAGIADPASAALPPMDELKAAAEHVRIEDLVLDESALTVYYADPKLQLDVGGIAKGYAVERVAQEMLTSDMPSFILSVGGNVRCGKKPEDGRQNWGVSIQDPKTLSGALDVVYVNDMSVVTSGDYERYYTVDGVRYSHLIDPDTLMPGQYMTSVTVVTQSSALADYLTKELFLTPYETSRAFAESIPGVEVMWVLKDGTIETTGGFRKISKLNGATNPD